MRGEPPELEFTHDDRLPPRFGEPKAPAEKDRLAPIPNLERTISDNLVLCQPRHRLGGKAGHLPPTRV